jgi:DNA-binding CsgD family transcriptional regulator
VAAQDTRHSIAGAISDLFARTTTQPSAVLLVGEPGIGKTTQLRAAASEAGALGYTVLATTGAVAESVPSYAALADLLAPVDDDVVARLPAPQRNALEQVRRVQHGATPTDQRAVAAALLSTIAALTERAPVLIAVDDVQWLDPSSAAVLAFVARRITGPVGVLAAVRADAVGSAGWLSLAWPDDLRSVDVPPLNLGVMHAMIQERQGHSLSRPVLTRIHRISGGNPFYALELSRAIDSSTAGFDPELPPTLVEMVRKRLAGLGADVEAVLLVAACATAPTLALVRSVAPPDAGDATRLLERAEDADVVTLDGDRVVFTHPLLAQGVHASATEELRRSTHRRLAEVVAEPESRARHLALAAVGPDPAAVDALDAAAESALVRGAPAAAAELTELALRLGGDTPERRIRLARRNLDAGDATRARELLEALVAEHPPGPIRSRVYHLLGLVRMFGDNFRDAADILETALAEGVDDPELAVAMRIIQALALSNAGMPIEAVHSASVAVSVAEQAGVAVLLSQALAMRTTLGFLAGEGYDEKRMRMALDLEGDPSAIAVPLRPSAHHAYLNSWTCRDPLAHNVLRAMRLESLESGDENAINILTFQSIAADVMYGAYAEAAATVEDALGRAQQSGSDVALNAAQTMRAEVAAHLGDVVGARAAIAIADAAADRADSQLMGLRTRSQLAFLEVSLGNYEAAWTAVEPLLTMLESLPAATEIATAMFLPDAIEAAIATGHPEVAESLVDLIAANGRRVDRAWMLAVAARGRGMIAATDGDLDAAHAALMRAMAEHDRLPMPFERARTQLVLGHVLRRQRKKDSAISVLHEALSTFEALGSPLWAERVRAELTPTSARRPRQTLTEAETRTSRLAASGLTNREIAAALFISQKTVEATLARSYRKLGIRNRSELGPKLVAEDDA